MKFAGNPSRGVRDVAVRDHCHLLSGHPAEVRLLQPGYVCPIQFLAHRVPAEDDRGVNIRD